MSRTRKLQISYWIVTVLFAVPLTWSAIQYLTEAPRMMETMVHQLGYPAYFPKILAIFKLLGVLAILTGTLPLMKEWAYAGFTFDLLGAFASHLSVGDSLLIALVPLAFLALLMASYLLWKQLPELAFRVPGTQPNPNSPSAARS